MKQQNVVGLRILTDQGETRFVGYFRENKADNIGKKLLLKKKYIVDYSLRLKSLDFNKPSNEATNE